MHYSNISLSTAYFPPIPWFALAVNANNIILEANENYIKQTYRNRCKIVSANGGMNLCVPIIHKTNHQSIRDIQISYDTTWQKIHFGAVESAYRRSPYYEFYIDDFLSFFTNKEKYLFDLNEKIVHVISEALHLDLNIMYSQEYSTEIQNDFRNIIHPKKFINMDEYNAPIYTQTFESKLGFCANMSILDLIFNVGPDTKELLVKSIHD